MTPQLRLMARRRYVGGGGHRTHHSYLRGMTSDPVIPAVRAFKCPTLTRRAATLMHRLPSTCSTETRGCCLVAPPAG